MDVARWSRLFDGELEAAAEARAFVRTVLYGHLQIEAVLLVVSELVTNAILHTASGGPSGLLVLELEDFGSHVHVAVIDQGADSSPVPQTQDIDDLDRETGRGLFTISLISKAWGSEVVRVGRRVWADVIGFS
ncbi:MAG: putative anti-sigma regulatory factor, serine/threonine protein kinase [Actinomycetia bacterium]|nr:putative anti-sigma regulatory factor, serine/threonine protein kinase [Actinomycetes bacterium]